MVIDTDCIDSCKSNCHTIMTTTVKGLWHSSRMTFTIPDRFSRPVLRASCVFVDSSLTTSRRLSDGCFPLREIILLYFFYATVVPLVYGQFEIFQSIQMSEFPMIREVVHGLNIFEACLQITALTYQHTNIRSPVIMTIIFKSKFRLKFYYVVFPWKAHRRVTI